MRLVKWSYTKRYNIKGIFDTHPNSPVIFRKIKDYYFIFTVKWDILDPPVKRAHLEEMEFLLNHELGTIEFYKQRKDYRYSQTMIGSSE